jgi:hypothetical protein
MRQPTKQSTDQLFHAIRSFIDVQFFVSSYDDRPPGMLVSLIGLVLVAAATAASQPWLDRHFLPSFLVSRVWFVRIEIAVRVTAGLIGVGLIAFARPIATRLKPIPWIPILGAIVLALVMSEVVLDRVQLRPAEWRAEAEEPRRQPDSRLGWVFAPARSAHAANRGGQTIEYVFDTHGYRVHHVGDEIDLTRPSNLFVGESIMFGDGLPYDASVPAQVQTSMHIQSINAAVYGYSADQTYLRLEEELHRVRHPVAVVALFMTELFGRNLDDDRPHLGMGLRWMPAQQHNRLLTLAGLLVPFRRAQTIETGIAVTRDVMRALVDISRAHGAIPLVVVPTIGPETEPQRVLRTRIFEGSGVPYLLIELDPSWHIPWDHHPDARASHVIAERISDRLRR